LVIWYQNHTPRFLKAKSLEIRISLERCSLVFAQNFAEKTHENPEFVLISKKIEMKIADYIFQVFWIKIGPNIKEHLSSHYPNSRELTFYVHMRENIFF
jgi:hypothetical protein